MRRGAVLCLVLVCTGCAPHAAPLPASASAHWHMALTLTPAVPRQLDPTLLSVRLSDSRGRPVSGATVTVSLVMPSMDMGQNQVTARAGAAGVYAATGRFTMPGRWQATVQAGKGTLHQTQSFSVAVQ